MADELVFPSFSDDDITLRRTAEQFTVNVLRPMLEKLPESDFTRESVLEILGAIKPFGLLGGRIPEEEGGDGLTMTQMGILYEVFPPEIAMAGCAADINSFRLFNGGSKELRKRYLPEIVNGRLLVASAISEPDAGSDISNIRTRALLDGDYYVVNGQKVWSSGGENADIFIVAASFGEDERGRSIIGRLLVDRRESEVTTRPLDMLGLARHGMAEVFFDNCRVPVTNLVGDPGDGEAALAESWLAQRVFVGLVAVNLAQEALDRSIEYAKYRTQFGKPIGARQLIQEMLVDMAIQIDSARYLCYKALALIDSGEPSRFASSAAKLAATRAAVDVTTKAMQIHGASGLSVEVGIEKLHRDAQMLIVPDGTAQVQTLIAGRELVGMSAIR